MVPLSLEQDSPLPSNVSLGLSSIVVDKASHSRRGTKDDQSDQLSTTTGERRGQFKASALPAVATAKVLDMANISSDASWRFRFLDLVASCTRRSASCHRARHCPCGATPTHRRCLSQFPTTCNTFYLPLRASLHVQSSSSTEEHLGCRVSVC
jgi:hypothetical protein